MLTLSLSDPADVESAGHAAALEKPLTGTTLEELRDKLVQFSHARRIDISEHFQDQYFATRPWKLLKDEQAPQVREPEPSLLLELAGTIYGISPGRLSLSGHED